MANILLIASATKVCSVAIAQNGKLACMKETIREEYSHAELLTVFMEELLHGPWRDKNLDAVAVMDGPGSYTGLRIGTSAAKGLCFAKDLPLIAIGSLYAWALGLKDKLGAELGTDDLVIPMMDARRMEVYYAIYDAQLNEIKAPAALVVDEDSVSELFAGRKVHLAGDGVTKCADIFEDIDGAVMHDLELSATFMAAEAERRFNANSFEDLAYFEPFYLKDFVPGKPKKLL
jgi:tRNA threonylcarbamoyladenosine biosynthesis protein TsaB